MVVTAQDRVRFLPFRTGGSPFPAGIWIGSVFGVGDASGGLINLNIEISTLTEPFSSWIMTLEQVEIQPTDASSLVYFMEARGFTTVGLASRAPRMGFNLQATSGGPAAVRSDEMLAHPLYLGQVSRRAGLDTEIHFQTSNVNGESYIVNVLGYYWEPGAMNAVGGPQRPLGPIFGG